MRKVALPVDVVSGLIEGDAMANQYSEIDMTAHTLLRDALRSMQPYKQILALEADEKLLRHIADYLDGLCEPGYPTKDRFGFQKAAARQACELMLFQLDQ
jgi:hypothetical protein